MGQRRFIGLFIGMVGPSMAFAEGQPEISQSPEAQVTFAKDVAPILYHRCAVCHNPNGVAPFPLLTPQDAAGKAEMIKEVVVERRMPPWHASPAHGKFKNDRRLTTEEIETIARWVDAGRPAGDLADMPACPDFSTEWRIGDPDLIVRLPEEVSIPATGIMPYVEFQVPTGFTEDKWVQAVEVRPDNPKVVHHISVVTSSPENETDLYAAFKNVGRGILAGYTPGSTPLVCNPDQGIRIPRNSSYQIQVHYTTTGKPETDRSSFGLKFREEPPERELFCAVVSNVNFVIPPRQANYRIAAESVVPRSAYIHAFAPHMHYRGKGFEYIAHYPDGRAETLLEVVNYDFNWQTYYELESPVLLPEGTRVEIIATFDNSPANPRNPDPSRFVRFGTESWDEMMSGGLALTWAEPDPPAAPVARASAEG